MRRCTDARERHGRRSFRNASSRTWTSSGGFRKSLARTASSTCSSGRARLRSRGKSPMGPASGRRKEPTGEPGKGARGSRARTIPRTRERCRCAASSLGFSAAVQEPASATRGLQDRAHALALLAAALVGTLLVPGAGLGQAEDTAVVALALEAAQGGLERLVGSDVDLDRHAGRTGGKKGALVSVPEARGQARTRKPPSRPV